jgi:2'-5' RNA ligase
VVRVRAFISLELTTNIKEEIGRVQAELGRAGVQAKWVRPEISHLTLAFFGSITPDKTEVINKSKALALESGEIGCFPNPARARIIFLCLKGQLNELEKLVKTIRQGLKRENIWFDEKPFKTHVTLGRLRKKQNLGKIIRQIKTKKINFLAKDVVFYQSVLTANGPVYEKIKAFSLR